VQNAMVGENTTLAGGLTAAAALFGVNAVYKYMAYVFPEFGRWVQGTAVMLVYQGHILQRNLRRTQITLDELQEAIREHGVSSLEQVNLAVLEADGNISILTDDFQRRTSRKRKSHRVISKEMG
jgi:uncharacterized membrane protein YcaP (DUF421 family)